MSIERRRSPRIELLGRIHGHVAALDVSVTVREISLGGMSLETSFRFPELATHEFRLTLGDGATTVLHGIILRCREHNRSDGSRVYISGVQFVDKKPSGGAEAIIDKMVSPPKL